MEHSWSLPQPYCSTLDVMEKMYPLSIYNSLTRKKNRFIPLNANNLTWYQCGPTVYDVSHVGHARTYVSLDIIRRIMKKYLGFNIILCQNITDIDDKIIIRSSESKTDFRELALKFEKEFLDNMTKLGVELPDIMTRVSEYVNEIIDYIGILVKKGFAYESNNSVYFNTSYFQSVGHQYGKLKPEAVGNSELLAEGEGALSLNCGSEKRSGSDFALWKKTKEHSDDGIIEPSWDSPWGPGRPGWHIECSVMSGSAMQHFNNGRIDIHAGGIDLKFPHHENEIAQSEAYLGCQQWINYWLHTGHVEIRGLKMSKSLKNFVTIQEALSTFTARQMRFCFLLHKYNEPMEYSDNTMNNAVDIEKIFSEFFHKVKAVLRRIGTQRRQHLDESELKLSADLEQTKADVHTALMDDFDTPRAVNRLKDLVNKSNRYIDGNNISSILLSRIGRYLTEIFDVFGLVNDANEIGFPFEATADLDKTGERVSSEKLLTPFLDVLTKFREKVRIAAISNDMEAVLEAADVLRDDILPNLGVRMEDKGSGREVVTLWKLDDPELLKKEKALRQEMKKMKEIQKAEALLKKKEKDERAKIPPNLIFKDRTDIYSAFDDNGIPTKDQNGEPLPKSSIKKLLKEYQQQKKLYEDSMQRNEDSEASLHISS